MLASPQPPLHMQELSRSPYDPALSYAFLDSAQHSISTVEMPDHISQCHATTQLIVQLLRRQMRHNTVQQPPQHYGDALLSLAVSLADSSCEQYSTY